ncbi:g6169 [Coccomyxa viridis]|uniref:G6169 protein n=1 Tax=Coccomyxa viridis TaxID=1274662 RepID=A0ABP1FZT5_9CHLO
MLELATPHPKLQLSARYQRVRFELSSARLLIERSCPDLLLAWATKRATEGGSKGFLWLRRTKAAGFSRKRNMPKFGACCAHDHDCEAADCGPSWSLHEHIDMSNVWALNEAQAGSVHDIFRPWGDRLDMSLPTLDSNDDDPELLIHVPFSGTVKIKAITIIGGSDGTAPAQLKVYTNREDLDFSTVAQLPPVQQWDLQENLNGQIEYPTQVTKFNGVHCVDLHIPNNFGADSTKIHFIGFKGEFTEAKREAVIAVYESKPLISDHKVTESMGPMHDVS